MIKPLLTQGDRLFADHAWVGFVEDFVYRIQSSPRWRFLTLATSVAVLGAMVVAVPEAKAAGPSVVTQTFSYTGSVASFTVPSGITSVTITVTGGQGGNGGADATPAAPAGGYRGVVTGTVAVTPNQVLTIGVGGGGATGASAVSATTAAALPGTNPLTGYAGGAGGKSGAVGSSGAGGAGGAASVVRIGGVDVVAGGGGGNGGSGQYASTRGRTATGTYAGRIDTTSTTGQTGVNANDACTQTGCANNDGGGSGGGGGGAQGGAQGQIQFGAGTSNEWYGFGGSVGQNSTASLAGLSASYEYYATNNTAGTVVISYTTGSPAAPTAVNGTAGNGAVNLIWTAPTDTGQSAITGYVARYSSNGGTTWSAHVDLVANGTSATVNGLTNGTSYIFQVAAVNSVGTGLYSASSSSVMPLGPPSAPTISLVTPQDGALGLTLVAPASGAPVTAYEYRVNGGSWVVVASTSTSIVIPGLLNGTSYSVEVRAESAVGVGTASAPVSGTPLAVPGAPTISSLAASNGAITVEFTPGFNGGGTITSYEYQLNSGSWVTVPGASSPLQITGLAAGTTYAVALRAVNSAGPGAASAPASATTPSAPGAPTITAATGSDRAARVTFVPGANGGSPILGYEYQTSAAGAWTAVPGAQSPVLISGLTNGTTYAVRIRAINALGTGPSSSAVSVTPVTVPGAPAIVGDTVAGTDMTLNAAFTAPASNGGSAITTYEYSTDAGATWRARTDGSGVASPLVITVLSSDGTTPLTNGETYSVELRAVNAVGAGAASAVATGISTAAPSKPSIITVTASSEALAVSFTTGSNGGSAITAYEYSIDHGASWTSTGSLSSSFVIGDLTNGTTYPVQVRAVNAVGTGAASAVVSGTPAGVPGQASIGGVVRSDQTLTTTVSVASNGGSPITAWQYSTDGGATWFTAPGTSSPLTLTVISSNGTTRLANGTGYALQVRAKNALGTGPASATTIVAPASAPAAPSIAVTAGNTSATVAFVLSTDGGSPVTQLEYSLDGGASWTVAGTLASPFTISGLTNGTTYGVRLRADNAIGAGTASVVASTTPRTVPGAPGSVVAVSNTSSADVSWAAPADNGGAAITGYTASAYTTSTGTTPLSSCISTGTSCTIPGLTNGSVYYVEVVATNIAGTGAASTPRVLVTPLARPGAPTLSALTVGDGSISAPFTAGTSGDRTITGYQYSLDGGVTWQAASGTTSPFVITGLTNGTLYTVAIRAVSSAGVGVMSNTRQGTPYTYPSAPDTTTIVANGGNAQITVSWAAANLNGGLLANYTATAFTGLTSGTTAATCTTTTLTCVITGLTNGTTYYVSLQTQNTAAMYSVRSAPRIPATPSMQPGAATSVSATAGDANATVSWIAPMSTGASAITGYTVWCSASGGTYTSCGTATGTSTVITGLTNGVSYTFKVYAVNSNGTGPASAASSAVTPLAPGTVPVLAAATSTVTGFTSSITNYDAATTYTATATNGATVVVSGSTVTVTGLAPGAASTVTVSAAKYGRVGTQANVTGSALLAGVTPVLGAATRTADGFSFSVTNFDPTSTYGVAASAGTATISGSTVTVTGLAPGAASTVTVTVSSVGHANASAPQSGNALGAGTVPVFSASTPLNGGYRFTITNYDAAQTYTLVQADGATVTRVGAIVTVSGLGVGASSSTTVTVTKAGFVEVSATQSGTSLPNGTAPVASAVTRTADGFTFTITVVPGITYTVTSDAGTVVLNGSTVTVTGLAPGATTSVHVTASSPLALDATTDVSGSALLVGITPVLGAATRTADGFSFSVTNFDPASSYTVAATSGAATISGSMVTVTGLTPGAGSVVTVTVSLSGSTDAGAAQSGNALGAGTVPAFSASTPFDGGYRFTIMNYDPSQTYTLTQTDGTVTRDGDTVTVTGLTAGASAQVTVTVAKPGYTDASATQSGTSLPTGTAPVASAVTSTPDGFSFTIVLVPGITYTVTSDAGTVVLNGSTITVTGLAPGASTAVHITASTPTALDATTTVNGSALLAGTTPEFDVPTRTADGYSFTVTNFDPASSYDLKTTDGTAAMYGSVVTVTGLAAGATSMVTVTVSLPGHADAAATQSGTALGAGTVPVFSAATPLDGGYRFTITNYDPALTYTLLQADGTVTRDGDTVTVSGLAAGATSTTTVTVSSAGHVDASASQAGTSLPTGTPPVASAVTRTPDGFTFTIDLVPGITYTVTSDAGTVVLDGSTVTVTGLAPGATTSVHVTASTPLALDATTNVTGSALVAGIAPVLGATTRTADGFSFSVTNFDPTSTYAIVPTAGSATISGSTVTVTGLAPGAGSSVTVTVSLSGSTDADAAVTENALGAGTVPVFSASTPFDGGYRFTITNYDPTQTYTLVETDGTVTRDGDTVTVTGLAAGASAKVSITVAKPGYTDASATQSGTSLPTGTTPVASAVTRTADGFTFTIDLAPGITYTVTSDAGTVVLDGSTVTVTGLAPGATTTVHVTASTPVALDATTNVTGTALVAGITPEFGVPTRTIDGYTFTITNLDAASSYDLAATNGTATLAGSTVTVTGLTPGQVSTVTVTVSLAGSTDASATQAGNALEEGIVPTFSKPTRTPDGFTVTVTNFDATSSYALLASDGTVTMTGSLVTVTGLAPDAPSAVTLTVSRAGSTDATATVTDSALGTGSAPEFSAPTPIDGGYRFTITNYDPALTYSLAQTGGTVSRDGDVVTVTGLAAGATAQTTVTVSNPGHVDATATQTGTSLPNGTAPTASDVTRTADGFTFTIELEPGVTYTVTSAAGTVVLDGNTVTVTGLDSGASTTVTITASKPGALDATTDVSGSALLAGIAPTFSTPVSTTAGFTVTITNFDAAFSYELITTAGAVTRTGSELTIAGLAPSASAVVHVVATRSGYQSAGSSVTGQALTPVPVPAPVVQPSTPTTPEPSTTPTTTTSPAPSGASASGAPIARLEESTAGSAAVTTGDTTVPSTITTSGGTVTVDARNGLTLSVAAQKDGSTLPLGVDGVVEVGPGGQLWVTVTGFGQGSVVSFWNIGNASELASASTDPTGAAATRVLLPSNLTPGAHTLVVTGVDAQGKTVTMQLGIRVTGTQPAVGSAAGLSSWMWTPAALLLLLGGWFWFVIARKRREDEEQEA